MIMIIQGLPDDREARDDHRMSTLPEIFLLQFALLGRDMVRAETYLRDPIQRQTSPLGICGVQSAV